MKGKLSPRYICPIEILSIVGKVAYDLDLSRYFVVVIQFSIYLCYGSIFLFPLMCLGGTQFS